MSSLLVVVTVASLAAHWSHWASVTQCPLLSHSIPQCSMAAEAPAQLGFYPRCVALSHCCVAAANSAVVAVDQWLVMLCCAVSDMWARSAVAVDTCYLDEKLCIKSFL